jgi:hypothetical protein
VLLDRFSRRFTRFPERKPQLATVKPGELHRIFDTHGVAVEEEGPNQLEETQMNGCGLLEISGERRLCDRLDLRRDNIGGHANDAFRGRWLP